MNLNQGSQCDLEIKQNLLDEWAIDAEKKQNLSQKSKEDGRKNYEALNTAQLP